MSEQPWDSRFESILRKYLTLLPPDQPASPDLSLVDFGLDSMTTVSLILELEEQFGVMIPDALLAESTFETPSGLWKVISSLTSGGSDS